MESAEVSGPFGSCLHSLCVSFFSLGVILMPMLSLLKENLGMSPVTHMAAHTSHNPDHMPAGVCLFLAPRIRGVSATGQT